MRRLLNLILVLSAWLCITGCGKPVRNVVVVWRTSEEDAIYHDFHQAIKKEFSSRGVRVRLEDCFLDEGNYVGVKLTDRLSVTLDKVEADGRSTDLVLAYGDYSHHLVMLSKDERLTDIPVVSFAVFGEEISGRPEKRRVTIIRDSITLKENLDFMKLVFNDRHRAISLLDWRVSWVDRQLLNKMSAQMSALDSSSYFSGLGLRCSVRDLDDAARAGKSVYYALSLESTSLNRNTETGEQFPATWAFFSQKSDNHVLMVKHDRSSELLERNPDFPLYVTAVAEGFMHHANCIGGHMSPFDVQVRDAVDKAMMIWDGAEPSDLPVTWHKRDYYVNWDALRGRMPLSSMPDNVHILGIEFSDSHPYLFRKMVQSGRIALVLIILALIAIMLNALVRNAHIRNELARTLRESIEVKNDLNMLLIGTNSVSWVIDGDRIVYMNDGLNVRNNVTLAERIEQSNPFYKEKLVHFFGTDVPGSYSLQIERDDYDGQSRWYELRMTVLDTLDGIRKSGLTINIDEEKKIEASLHEAHRKLALANERENFISTMSHEMRTPLNSIVGFSQILTTPGFECTEEELILYGKAIDESNQELMKIIEDMLALTHMDNSNIRIDLRDYSLSDVFDRFEAAHVGYDNVPGRTVHYVKGPADSSITVDITLLEIVWKNIIGNAIKFSSPETPVSAGWTESMDSVRLYVSDEGIGIDKSQQEFIFNRFYQVDHFTQGTGLGLALAKEYVTRMGGTISVDSELGTGSTFYVSFPKSKGGTAA